VPRNDLGGHDGALAGRGGQHGLAQERVDQTALAAGELAHYGESQIRRRDLLAHHVHPVQQVIASGRSDERR
jgi:hypothetical protein